MSETLAPVIDDAGERRHQEQQRLVALVRELAGRCFGPHSQEVVLPQERWIVGSAREAGIERFALCFDPNFVQTEDGLYERARLAVVETMHGGAMSIDIVERRARFEEGATIVDALCAWEGGEALDEELFFNNFWLTETTLDESDRTLLRAL